MACYIHKQIRENDDQDYKAKTWITHGHQNITFTNHMQKQTQANKIDR